MSLKGKKIAILLESDYCEHEIWYYKNRFAEEEADVVFMTRLWGYESLTFKGHDHQVPFVCNQSFEGKDGKEMDEDELNRLSAIIVPSGFVADRLRYTEDLSKLPPATAFMKRAFANRTILKGLICHGLWLLAPTPNVIRGRRVVAHNNLHGDVINMGAEFVDEDVVVDGDLVTARTGDHCHLFARRIIDLLHERHSYSG
jgi:protease I